MLYFNQTYFNRTYNFAFIENLTKFADNLSFEMMSIQFNSKELDVYLLNESRNASHDKNQLIVVESDKNYLEIVFVSLVLGLLILATVLGNIFVISAIILEKNLKCVGNYLVLSLAVTDLLVACLVMPLGAVYEVAEEWSFGAQLCELWTSVDVLCCTASILHLLAIALDRFWAVTNVDYVHQRNARHIGAMILTVWIVATVISLAPIFGWKDADFNRRINEEKRCLVSQDVSYQVFATMFSFYGPTVLLLFLYYRIYLEARKRIRRKSSNLKNQKNRRPNSCPPAPTTFISSEITTTTMTNNLSSSNGSSDNGSANSYQVLISANSKHLLFPPQSLVTPVIIPDYISAASTSDFLEVPSFELQKENSSNGDSADSPSCSTISYNNIDKSQRQNNIQLKKFKFKKSKLSSNEAESKRERKAAKTLAIITGIFIVCWLPFFVVALIMPLCPKCYINSYLFSFCLWLGWANSSVNPFLYTIFSPDFRCAFRRMLFGRKHRVKR